MADLAPHQQRVIAEKHELDDKLAKLDQFNASIKLGLVDVGQLDADLLLEQAGAMHLYSDILRERIERFTNG